MTQSAVPYVAVLAALCAACVGQIGDDLDDARENGAEETDASSSALLSTRRLTKTQIKNTLADVFGVDGSQFDELAEVATDGAKYGQFTNEAARVSEFVDHDV
jgi:hypothetical protein